MNSDDPAMALRAAAMDLLARREHSRHELLRKLGARFPSEAEGPRLAAVLDRLAEEGLQSDERCAEALVRSGRGRGQGPLRIRQDLWQRGIVDQVASAALAGLEDWHELAAAVLTQKFGGEPPEDRKQWARRARFLASRGFPEGLVRQVLKASEDGQKHCSSSS